jgi:hypothetical protein
MRISRRWAIAGLAGGGALAIAVVISTAPAGPWRGAGSSARTQTRPARTGSAEVSTPTSRPHATLIASPPATPARIRSGLPTCARNDRPYPGAAPLRTVKPATLYFVNSAAPAGWRLDVPDLGIVGHDFDDPLDQVPTVVHLYARDFENSQAGPHTATLTWPPATSGGQDCKYTFWLKRGSKLSMTVTPVGAARRITGQLTWTSFGRQPRDVGHSGQTIRIRYREGRKYVYLRPVTTDDDGRYEMTITAGQHIWQATYAGIATANGLYSPEVTG